MYTAELLLSLSLILICTQQSYCSLSLAHSSLLCPKVTWYRAGWVRESSPARDPIPSPPDAGRLPVAGRRPLILPPPSWICRLPARRGRCCGCPPVAASSSRIRLLRLCWRRFLSPSRRPSSAARPPTVAAPPPRLHLRSSAGGGGCCSRLPASSSGSSRQSWLCSLPRVFSSCLLSAPIDCRPSRFCCGRAAVRLLLLFVARCSASASRDWSSKPAARLLAAVFLLLWCCTRRLRTEKDPYSCLPLDCCFVEAADHLLCY